MILCSIYESNDCHTPAGSPAGGQFCGTSGSKGAEELAFARRKAQLEGRSTKTGPQQAQHFPGGTPVDLPGLAQVNLGLYPRVQRRFLFNPKTKEFIVGVATGVEGRDLSHAEAFDKALGGQVGNWQRQAHLYDAYTVHGHIGAGPNLHGDQSPLTIQVDRLTTQAPSLRDMYLGDDRDAKRRAFETAKTDDLFKFFSWTTSRGAKADTEIWVYDPVYRQGGVPFKKAAPELFRKRKAKKAA